VPPSFLRLVLNKLPLFASVLETQVLKAYSLSDLAIAYNSNQCKDLANARMEEKRCARARTWIGLALLDQIS
jgi:hypothetical protein